MNRSAMRLGAAWYLLPVLIFLLLVVVVPVGMIAFAVRDNPVAFQLLAPGAKDFEIRKPGTYMLWDEVQTVYAGKAYSSSNQLPTGIEFRLVDLTTSNQIAMSSMKSQITMRTTMRISVGLPKATSQSTVRTSVGTFDITTPGKYRLSVEGQFPPRVFYFRSSIASGVLTALSGVGIAAIGLLASILVAAFIFFKRRSSRG